MWIVESVENERLLQQFLFRFLLALTGSQSVVPQAPSDVVSDHIHRLHRNLSSVESSAVDGLRPTGSQVREVLNAVDTITVGGPLENLTHLKRRQSMKGSGVIRREILAEEMSKVKVVLPQKPWGAREPPALLVVLSTKVWVNHPNGC